MRNYIFFGTVVFIGGHSRDLAAIIAAEFLNVSAKRSRKSDVSAAPVAVRQGVSAELGARHAADALGAGRIEVALGEWHCVL